MRTHVRTYAAFGLGTAGLLLTALGIACSDSKSRVNTVNAPADAAHNGHMAEGMSMQGMSMEDMLPAVAITAIDFSFDAPASLPAGLTHITFQNNGQEDHHAQIARLHDGVTVEQLLSVIHGDNPDAVIGLVSLAGGPSVTSPGGSGDVVVNLEPGSYVLLCFVSGEDGVPHVVKGMIKPFDVTGEAAADAVFPPSQATVTLRDFSFDVPATLPAGTTTLLVTNEGPQPHEMAVLRLDGIGIDQLIAILSADDGSAASDGPPPVSFVGGINALDPGKTAEVTLALTPGVYGLVCFVPDPATGQPHVALGMVGGFTVE